MVTERKLGKRSRVTWEKKATPTVREASEREKTKNKKIQRKGEDQRTGGTQSDEDRSGGWRMMVSNVVGEETERSGG